MGWDGRRTVPWRRLLIEWGVLWVVGGGLLALVTKEPVYLISVFIGGGVYVAIAAVLAKFGYVRASYRQLRAETLAAQAAKARQRAGASSARSAHRPRPAATSRTNAGNRRSPRRR